VEAAALYSMEKITNASQYHQNIEILNLCLYLSGREIVKRRIKMHAATSIIIITMNNSPLLFEYEPHRKFSDVIFRELFEGNKTWLEPLQKCTDVIIVHINFDGRLYSLVLQPPQLIKEFSFVSRS
jgi:hypothetical protein